MTFTELAHCTVPAAPLVASVSADGTSTVVILCGKADLFTLPVVVDVLARAIADSDGPVVVDLSNAEFIDTATVRALARARQFLNDRGRTLTLRSPSKVAARVLELLGVARLMSPTG